MPCKASQNALQKTGNHLKSEESNWEAQSYMLNISKIHINLQLWRNGISGQEQKALYENDDENNLYVEVSTILYRTSITQLVGFFLCGLVTDYYIYFIFQ
jgi:hypothetical protein